MLLTSVFVLVITNMSTLSRQLCHSNINMWFGGICRRHRCCRSSCHLCSCFPQAARCTDILTTPLLWVSLFKRNTALVGLLLSFSSIWPFSITANLLGFEPTNPADFYQDYTRRRLTLRHECRQCCVIDLHRLPTVTRIKFKSLTFAYRVHSATWTQPWRLMLLLGHWVPLRSVVSRCCPWTQGIVVRTVRNCGSLTERDVLWKLHSHL